MYEYGSVSAHDLDSLVAQLNERGQDDWEAVSVFATASGYQAVVKRSAASAGAAEAVTPVDEVVVDEAVVEEAVAPVEVEPEGWGAAPEPVLEEPVVEEPAIEEPVVTPAPAAAAGGFTPVDTGVVGSGYGATTATEPAPAPTPTPEPRPVVTTPAGWYPDPSGRYELRYWNGSEWTEYVARGGQQYTDPPVA